MAGAALALLVPLSHPALLREAAAKEENRALNELPAVPADVLAREQALAKANPHELALAEAKVAYAEYLIKGELASGELALASASPELIRKRITQIEPWAEYVVDRWATTVDTDAVRLEGPLRNLSAVANMAVLIQRHATRRCPAQSATCTNAAEANALLVQTGPISVIWYSRTGAHIPAR